MVPGLLLSSLVPAACLLDAYRSEQAEARGAAPSVVGQWRVPPWPVGQRAPPTSLPTLPKGLGVLSSARLAMSAVHTLIYIINITHLIAMRFAPRSWVFPRSRLVRARNVGLFYAGVTAALLLALLAGLLEPMGVSIKNQGDTSATGGLATWEVLITSVVYQISLLMTVLLGKRNFTYAELIAVVTFGSNLVIEATSLMVAKFVHNPVPHTMRPPHALLIYHLALVVGTFLLGFLLSPLLWLSRSLAQRPTHRLRWPEKRHQNRKLLAVSITTLAVIFIGGVLGSWAQWFLHTNPWVWAVRFAFNLETIDSPPNSLPWSQWSSIPHLRLAGWWAGCLLASIVFWWWCNGGSSSASAPTSSTSSPSSALLVPPTFSAARCFGSLRALQKRAMSPLAPRPMKRRSFQMRPRGANGTTSSGNGRLSDPSLSAASLTVAPLSHGNSSDTEPDDPGEVDGTYPYTPYDQATPTPPTRKPLPQAADKMGDVVVQVNDLPDSPTGETSTANVSPPIPRTRNNDALPTIPSHPMLTSSTPTKRYPPMLSLNAKRKFFHLLAVLLFVPGFIADPTFVHLAMSLAFSFFIFCEYTRFFALYPLGAPLHVFLTRFIDNKDTGPVLLSPFYLLLGCALPLWVETRPSALSRSAAALALGVADAAASVVGKKWGVTRWPQSRKTVEGTLAFIVSLSVAGYGVHLVAPSAHWNGLAWITTATALGLFEGVGDQNDNLTLPCLVVVLMSLFQL